MRASDPKRQLATVCFPVHQGGRRGRSSFSRRDKADATELRPNGAGAAVATRAGPVDGPGSLACRDFLHGGPVEAASLKQINELDRQACILRATPPAESTHPP